MSDITVLLAEDHTIVREGLRALLASESDITIIGEAGDGRMAVHLASTLRADVIVMDIAMPLLNGIEATRQILHHLPQAKILILSAHSDDAYVEQVMALGAKGYLIKQTAANVLAESIRRVYHGDTCFSPLISRRLQHHEMKAQASGELHAKKEASLCTTFRKRRSLFSPRTAMTHMSSKSWRSVRKATSSNRPPPMCWPNPSAACITATPASAPSSRDVFSITK